MPEVEALERIWLLRCPFEKLDEINLHLTYI